MNKTQLNKIIKLKEGLQHEEKSYKLLSANEDKIIMIMPNGSIAYILNKTESLDVSDINYNTSPENIVNSFLNKSLLKYKEYEFNIEDIKAFKKEHKNEIAQHHVKHPYKFEMNEQTYGFNYNYFLDVISIMGKDCKCSVSNLTGEPFIFKSDIGIALLMPVRIL